MQGVSNVYPTAGVVCTPQKRDGKWEILLTETFLQHTRWQIRERERESRDSAMKRSLK